jgi:NAD-dependent SIR2 family protein deacetylase
MDHTHPSESGVREYTMAEKALRDFDRVREALADKDVAGARKVLNRSRRRASQMPPNQRQQAEALIKLAQQNIKGFNEEAARSATAEQRRQLLTAKCVGCGKPGSQNPLIKKSGSARCAACHHTWAHPKCTKCGEPFKRDVSMPRQRVCPACGGGNAPTLRTVSGGLPTLGRRR